MTHGSDERWSLKDLNPSCSESSAGKQQSQELDGGSGCSDQITRSILLPRALPGSSAFLSFDVPWICLLSPSRNSELEGTRKTGYLDQFPPHPIALATLSLNEWLLVTSCDGKHTPSWIVIPSLDSGSC